MDKEFKTTFIPKKNLSSARTDVKSIAPSRKTGLIGALAGLLFITAIVSVIAVYFYKMQIVAAVNKKIDSINLAEKAFEPAVILKLKKLDIRLRAATELLDKHIALADFFESLGETTLPSISFSDFSFAFNEEGSEVSMSGEARGFTPIAQQSDQFEDNRYIRNHIFSDFAITETGNVSFSLVFTLDPDLLTYGRSLANTQVDTVIEDGLIIENQPGSLLPAGENINFNSLN